MLFRSGKSVSTCSGAVDGRVQRVLAVVGRNQPGELQLVQVEIVIVDAESRTQDRPASQVVRRRRYEVRSC